MTGHAPQDNSEQSPVRPWRRWFWRAALGALALFIVVGGPYLWHLDKQVRDQFAQLQWQVPTRVYARPLVLSPGVRLDGDALEIELALAAYRKDGIGQMPGTYARDGGHFRIATRAFTDLDGPVRERQLDVVLSGGEVTSVRGATSRLRLDSARIDPARIATIYGNSEEERRLVRMEEVPELLITGLQAVEDRNFKHHHGIDPWGVARAMWVNLRQGEYEQGASTLTQQLVRSLFLSNTKTLTRKVKEVAYALIIESRFDKRAILEAYLNQVYLGQQGNQSVHGIAAGADFWFGRDLSNLRTEDMALLVGIIQGPAYWDPRRFPARALSRRATVLQVWQSLGLISPEEAQRAAAAPLNVSATPGVARNRAPAFMDLVRRQLARDYPADALKGAGLSVMTTLSPTAQALAEHAVTETLAKIQRPQGPALQAGVVVTDTGNGEVLAMIGNRQTDQPGFDRALESQRPVGSLLKPFVYLLALAQPERYSLSSWVDDSPVEITMPNGKPWRPQNSDGQSHGTVTVTSALAHSYNQATVRVGMDVGPDRLSSLMQVLAGLRAEANPSLILGSVDLSVFSMAQMYQFLASGGQLQPLRAVRGVLDPNGKAINRYDYHAAPAQSGDAIAARLVTLALQNTITIGTGRQLLGDGLGYLQAAGKTGTSNDSRDSWFAGYTGDHLAVVWVGNDQNAPTGLYGATGAMKVWSALFSKLPTSPLTVSSKGIEWAWLDATDYATTDEGCPGARRAAFVAGFQPSDHKSCQDSSWLDWFHLGGNSDGSPPPDQPPPTDQPPPPTGEPQQ